MEDSSIANKGLEKYNSFRENNNFALIAILVTLIAVLVTIFCSSQVYPYDLDPGNFCHLKNQSTQTDQLRQREQQQRRQKKEPDPMTNCSKDDSSLKFQHLTDTRSTQVYPTDLDQGNYCHPKNRSTHTDKLQQRDHGVQTVSYSQSSSASQTACFLDITSRLRPFSDNKTDNNSYRSSAPTTYKLDGPWIHGPFFCDCPGGVCKHRSSAPTTNPSKLKPDDGPRIHGPFSCDCPGGVCIFRS